MQNTGSFTGKLSRMQLNHCMNHVLQDIQSFKPIHQKFCRETGETALRQQGLDFHISRYRRVSKSDDTHRTASTPGFVQEWYPQILKWQYYIMRKMTINIDQHDFFRHRWPTLSQSISTKSWIELVSSNPGTALWCTILWMRSFRSVLSCSAVTNLTEDGETGKRYSAMYKDIW